MRNYTGILLFLVLIGCSKNDEVLPPAVTFNEPLENTFFNVPAEILVRASLNSENPIESVGLRLVDQNYSPVSDQEMHYPGTTSFELNDYLNIQDIYLESGEYFIEIDAVSSGESKKKYRAIQMVEFPRDYEGLVLTHESGELTRLLGGIDSLEISTFDNALSNSHTDLVLSNNFASQVILAYSNGNLMSFDKISGQVLWEYDDYNPAAGAFYNDAQVNVSDRQSYFSTSQGELLGFNNFGSLSTEISLGENVSVEDFIIDGDKVICEVKQGANDHRIKVISLLNGAILSQKAIEMDVSNIIKLEDNQYLIAGEGMTAGDVLIQVFHAENNALFSPQSFDFGHISDVVMTSAGFVALAHNTGIYTYDPQTDAINYLSEYTQIENLAFDEVNNLLILASAQEVYFYSLPMNQEIISYYFNDPIVQFDLLYNK